MQRHALPAPPAPLPPGRHIEGFELQSCAGEDLDGFLYRATDRRTHREVAIREFFPVGLVERDGDRVQAWPGVENEYSRLLARWIVVVDHLALVDHPALVRVEDYWLRGGTAYVLTPWLGGRPLRALREAAPAGLDRRDIEAWIGTCCDALDLLHRGGDVHGSLSPERLTVLDGGQLVLPLPDMDPSRQPYSLWLAPEQAERPPEGWQVGPWTDVHGVAAIAHWLFTGAPPPGLARRRSGDPDIWQPLAQATGEGPWCDVIVRALSPDPARRPASVAELREALGLVVAPVAPIGLPVSAAVRVPAHAAVSPPVPDGIELPVLVAEVNPPGAPALAGPAPAAQSLSDPVAVAAEVAGAETVPVPVSEPVPVPRASAAAGSVAAPKAWSAVADQPVSQVSIAPLPLSRRKPPVAARAVPGRHRAVFAGLLACLALGAVALLFQRPAGPPPAETAGIAAPTPVAATANASAAPGAAATAVTSAKAATVTPAAPKTALPVSLDQLPPTAAGPAAASARKVLQATPPASVTTPAPKKLTPLPPKPKSVEPVGSDEPAGNAEPKPARRPVVSRAAPARAVSQECIDLLRRRSLEAGGSGDEDAAFKTVCR